MTTQVPYGPAKPAAQPAAGEPPAATYPTAPPWANTPVEEPAEKAPGAAPAYRAVAPYGAPIPAYGQLLVPFPEEMQNAARMKAPAWWPVVLWTLLAGLPGLLSASRRAAQARRGRNSPLPYWVAYGVTALIISAIGVVVQPSASTAWTDFRERAHTQTLQTNLVKDGQLKDTAKVTATSAQCDPSGPRGADDLRRYSCLLKLSDGSTGTLDVTADPDGNWTAVPLKKK